METVKLFEIWNPLVVCNIYTFYSISDDAIYTMCLLGNQSAGAKPPAPALPDKSAPVIHLFYRSCFQRSSLLTFPSLQSTTTLPLPHPLAEAVASPSPLSSLSAEVSTNYAVNVNKSNSHVIFSAYQETHLKVSEKASPASSVPMSNAPVRSGHHQGLMACKCGHKLGNLPFPLKSGLIHSNGSCKWMCCNLKWSEDICPIVGAAAVPALPKAALADLSYTSVSVALRRY